MNQSPRREARATNPLAKPKQRKTHLRAVDPILGREQTLQPVWRQFGIEPQKTGREHTAIVVLLSADGRQRIGFPLSELTPEGIAHDVRVLQREVAAQ